ncbi:Uma2 family endonuclease [Roseofilum casamattae]|uniref:Uma2 family endonuclease n=1 Tax=Roseofilum casamattae BLCC-M143 TaxID=3022442 RepID=A0ABT7C011_9CYAN|nr:Uma2 family endonuclease [Roseofilum casamattae]MDJ1184800.1 Uma2 family endonuclease [Roseofilum casamattae BLCC-M143]
MLSIVDTTSIDDQQFLIPGCHSWQQFQTLQRWVETIPGLRVSYVDGYIQFMTTSKKRERIKKLIAILLEAYFFEMEIPFFPAGNTTCEAEERDASFSPDESYCLEEDKDYPDLAIEVALTSGGVEKMEKYRRFEIPEVWLWQNDRLLVYVLRSDFSGYDRVQDSKLLPNLNVSLLEECLQITDVLSARRKFLHRDR